MKKIILASASPRRKDILEKFGFPFKIKKGNIEEKIDAEEKPEQIAMSLAFEKAIEVSKSCNEGEIVIAADTIVVKNGILGKPKNYEEAFSMLKMLQDDIHDVITGLAVIEVDTYNKFVTFEKTKVKMKQLTDDEIKRYIDTGEVWDKAGSYGIQGKGSALIEWVYGDYFNVVGLPIAKLQSMLSKYFDLELI
ncbi:Maf family protein [Crassaminicella indica]|uniref:dTTP/UTP pyrophosphatase n=1 Tax=Crassaminicella indica TaxID=2855394 RepID=A0ABX8RBA8_9CLOT|nr:Maf family protein [Crassaminicella indica]QXM05754.1 Maf family protein [Crassaminicella indica]